MRNMQDQYERKLLARKLMCKCPICNANIYAKHLGLQNVDVSKITSFPFAHQYNPNPSQNLTGFQTQFPCEHHLNLYIDANFAVRDVRVIPEKKEIILSESNF